MPNPVVIREKTVFDEVFVGGTLTGIQTTVTMRVDGEAVVVSTAWSLPENEHLSAEEWMAQKRTIGPSLVLRAAQDTNLEYEIMTAVQAHIAAAAS